MLFKVLILSVALVLVHTYSIGDLEGSFSHHQEKGAGKEYSATQQSSEGEKGSKGYSGHHETEKGAQGHHDKENQKKQYAEEGGHKKGYNHKDGYYAEQHKGEKGQKGHHFEDKGSYAKGHSTKGHHNVHKLNEFKKDKEFYDEDHDEAHKEKHGGFEAKQGASAGGHAAGGHFKKVFIEGDFGKKGEFAKGSHYFDENGHKKAQGHEGHFANGAEFEKKGGNEGSKNYGFSHLTHH